jgi:uncharacterized protein YjbJ (UPF0337 family)
LDLLHKDIIGAARQCFSFFMRRIMKEFISTLTWRHVMNQDQMQGQYKQLKGKIKQVWGELTDDDLSLYDGARDRFLGRVQEKYGIAKEDANKRLKEIEQASRATDRAA